MSKKKVCIVTWYRSINYGTVIQCLALSKALEKMGYETYVPEHLRRFSLSDPGDIVRRLFRKLAHKIKPANAKVRPETVDSAIAQGYAIRTERLEKLIAEELRIYPMNGRKAFDRLCADMDAFVTGSDQIWNPHYIAAPFLLSFARETDLKIAYSSSIGVAQLPQHLKPMYRKYLSRFSAIGVREESARRILTDLLPLPVQTVLDPSFLLSREDWRHIAREAVIPDEYRQMQGYIFCYFIGDKEEWKKDAQLLSRRYQLPIVCCLSESYIVPQGCQVFAQAGVREFLWMIDHASMVLTDSFHAAALSLNHRKEFAVYKRFDDTDTASQNARIIDVLQLFKVQSRLVTAQRNAQAIFEEKIPYEKVGALLAAQIDNSLHFLRQALEGTADASDNT